MDTAPQLPSIYQLKIELQYIEPLIWRRVLVPSDYTLLDLHHVIQAAMGWVDYHLHQYEIEGVRYAVPDPEEGPSLGLEGGRDETVVTLAGVAPREQMRFTYEYDFGDGWRHELTVERISPPEKGKRYPICLAGERNGPPEDSGGPHGYEDFVAALRDPKHPNHAMYVDWIGEAFDPEHFDLDYANVRLGYVRRAQRRAAAAEKAGTEANVEDALASLRVPKAMREQTGRIMTLADQFAAEHLDPEYVPVTRRFIAALARKRPSPLLQEEPRVWAAVALSVVLGLNVVFDPERARPAAEGQFTRSFGVSAARLQELGEAVMMSTSLGPMDLVLPRYRQQFEDLTLWLMDVQVGLADPQEPPPGLHEVVARMQYLQELEDAQAPEPEAKPRPHLRLIELPPEEEEE